MTRHGCEAGRRAEEKGKGGEGKQGGREEKRRKGEERKVQRYCYFIVNTYPFVYMVTK